MSILSQIRGLHHYGDYLHKRKQIHDPLLPTIDVTNDKSIMGSSVHSFASLSFIV